MPTLPHEFRASDRELEAIRLLDLRQLTDECRQGTRPPGERERASERGSEGEGEGERAAALRPCSLLVSGGRS